MVADCGALFHWQAIEKLTLRETWAEESELDESIWRAAGDASGGGVDDGSQRSTTWSRILRAAEYCSAAGEHDVAVKLLRLAADERSLLEERMAAANVKASPKDAGVKGRGDPAVVEEEELEEAGPVELGDLEGEVVSPLTRSNALRRGSASSIAAAEEEPPPDFGRERSYSWLIAEGSGAVASTELQRWEDTPLPSWQSASRLGAGLRRDELRTLQICESVLLRGALQPWPRTLVELISQLKSTELTASFVRLAAQVRRKARFVAGAEVQVLLPGSEDFVQGTITNAATAATGQSAPSGGEPDVRSLLRKSPDMSEMVQTSEASDGGAVQSFDVKVSGWKVTCGLPQSRVMSLEVDGVAGILHAAATLGNAHLVKELLQCGESVFTIDQRKRSALHYAAEGGHDESCRLLMAARADIHTPDGAHNSAYALAFMGRHTHVRRVFEPSPQDLDASERHEVQCDVSELMAVSYDGSLEAVERLLRARADVAHRSARHCDALSMAAEMGHVDVARCLLEHKADVNAEASDGTTALMIVSRTGSLSLAQLCIRAGASIQSKVSGAGRANDTVALIIAAGSGHAAICSELLDARAEVNFQRSDGISALHIACDAGHTECVRVLLQAGARTDLQTKKKASRPLVLATRMGHEEIVRCLLEAEVDVYHRRDGDGMTALCSAAANGFDAVVRTLLAHLRKPSAMQKGVAAATSSPTRNPSFQRSGFGSIPIAQSVQRAAQMSEEALEYLEAGVAHSSGICTTALMQAAHKGHDVVLRSLLQGGANVDAQDPKTEITALHLASDEGHEACVSVLLNCDADVDAETVPSRQTPLHLASQNGHASVVTALLRTSGGSEARVNARTSSGATALYLACENGHLRCVRVLLRHGANTEVCVVDGTFALTIAAQQGHATCVDAILTHLGDNALRVVNVHGRDGSSALDLARLRGHTDVVELLEKAGGQSSNATTATGRDEPTTMRKPASLRKLHSTALLVPGEQAGPQSAGKLNIARSLSQATK